MGVSVQGLIPARRQELAVRISETVDEKLLSQEDIQKVLSSPEIGEKLVDTVEAEVEAFLDATIRKIPLASNIIDNAFSQTIKDIHLSFLQREIPKILGILGKRLSKGISFKTVVREKIENYDLQELEEIVYGIAATELKAIEILGGVIGLIVGLAQLAILLLI